MTPSESERDILIRVDQKVTDMHRELLDENGRVPLVERDVKKHAEQIHFWRGAIALFGILILTFGGVLLAHVMGGH